jgi:putative transposase
MSRFPLRKKIRLQPEVYHQGHAFFITISTHQKYPWFSKYPNLCKSSIQLMRDLAQQLTIKMYAWCIMPDHIHYLIQGVNIIKFIRLFKGKMTPKARALKPERKLWQRSFFDHALRSDESLYSVACYIWENPVRAAIVQEPDDYLWSGSIVWANWRSFYR